MSQYHRRKGPDFWDTDRQVATVVMKTVQLVLSIFKNFQRIQRIQLKIE